MSKIEFESNAADITRYRLDKKGKEAEKVKLIHLSIECELPSSILSALTFNENMQPNLWDVNGDKLFHGIGYSNSIAKFENHVIQINELVFEDVSLKSFKFKAINQNMVSVSFKTTVQNPNEHQESVLSDHFKETVAIKVIAPEGDNIDDTDQMDLDQET